VPPHFLWMARLPQPVSSVQTEPVDLCTIASSQAQPMHNQHLGQHQKHLWQQHLNAALPKVELALQPSA
jgi:hypothetical protein